MEKKEKKVIEITPEQGKKVNEILKDNLLIKRVELKKIYPNKLQIKVHEKEPIAIINKKEGRLYLTQTGEEIKFFKNSKLKDLPNIFGKQKNFIKIYSSLKNLQFPILCKAQTLR